MPKAFSKQLGEVSLSATSDLGTECSSAGGAANFLGPWVHEVLARVTNKPHADTHTIRWDQNPSVKGLHSA